MIHKANSSPIKQWSALLVFPLVLLVLFAFAEPEYTMVTNKKPQSANQAKAQVDDIAYQTADLATENKTETVVVNPKLVQSSARTIAAVKTKSPAKKNG